MMSVGFELFSTKQAWIPDSGYGRTDVYMLIARLA